MVIKHPVFLLYAIPFVFGTLILHVITWRIIINDFDGKINYSNSIFIYNFSALSRYIPGNYWYIISRSVLGKEKGLSYKNSILSSGIELIFNILSAVLISTLIRVMGFTLNYQQFIWLLFIFILILFPILIFLKIDIDKINNKEVKNYLEKIKILILSLKTNIYQSPQKYFFLFLLFICIWLSQGLSFYFILSTWGKINFQYIPIIVTSYATGWVIGFLNPLTPNGIGTRETIFITILKGIIPVSTLLGASLIIRIFVLIGEFILALISWLFLRKINYRN